MTVTPLGRDQDCSLKNREPDVPAPWFLDPGGWSKTAAVSLYFIFPGICTLSLLESFGKREPHLRICSHQIGLWKILEAQNFCLGFSVLSREGRAVRTGMMVILTKPPVYLRLVSERSITLAHTVDTSIDKNRGLTPVYTQETLAMLIVNILCRFVLSTTLVREASYGSGWWLMQGFIASHSAE
ncbi:hypothetical protein STEG23_004704, partial [Scotinomys teguina]